MHAYLLGPLLQLLTAAAPASVLVMPLSNKEGVSDDLAEQVTAVVVHVANAQPGFQVVALADVQGAMSQEQLKQIAGCDDVSCAAELGGVLNTQQVVLGTLGLVGDQYLLSLTRVSSKDGRRLGSVVERVNAKPTSALFDRLEEAVPPLFGLPRPAAKVVAAPPVQVEATPAVAPVEEAGFPWGRWVLRGLGGAGLVAAIPPVLVGMVLGAFVTSLLIQDQGPTLPGVPKHHFISPVQALAGDVSLFGTVCSGLVSLAGVALSVGLIVVSLAGA